MSSNSVKIGYVDGNIGSHVKFLGNIYKTLALNIKRGMMGIQFFMGSPTNSWKRANITEEDIKLVRNLCIRFPSYIFSHFPYISNLAGTIKCLAWGDNDKVTGRVVRILKSLKYELGVLSNFKNSGVVIHPGNYPNRKEGLKTISKSINYLVPFISQHKNSENIHLLLENSAGAGNSLGRNFKEIKEMLDGVDKRILKNINVCVDTAHIWGAGEYQISSVEEIDRMFKEFDEIIGMQKFHLLHLNDSLVKFGSKKDRHAPIGEGEIWKNDIQSLIYLIDRCNELNIPIILETVISDMLFLASIQKNLKTNISI